MSTTEATAMWVNFAELLKRMADFVDETHKNRNLPIQLRVAALDANIGLMKMHVIVQEELIRAHAIANGLDMTALEELRNQVAKATGQ